MTKIVFQSNFNFWKQVARPQNDEVSTICLKLRHHQNDHFATWPVKIWPAKNLFWKMKN